jgi:hypothetical protein
MFKSRCCKEEVEVICANEGVQYYVCDHCHVACDTILVKGDYCHDDRINADNTQALHC